MVKENSKSKTDLNSTEKVLKMLTAFLPTNESRGTIELSNMLGIHRASVSRILGILKEYDFVQQDPRTKRYRLGPAVASLGQALRQSLTTYFLPIVRPHIHRLSETLEAEVALFVMLDHDVIMPYFVESGRGSSYLMNTGDREAINANAGSKAILAYYSDNQLEEIKKAHPKLPSYTSNTITNWGKFKEHLQEIRRNSISYDLQEYSQSIFAVASTFFDYDNKPAGAITILVPPARSDLIHNSDTIKLLKETTHKISSNMMNPYYK